MKEYEAYYADARFCVELNGLWKKCKTPGGPPTVFRLLPEGNYTAEAYITDKTGEARYHETEVVTFTVVGSREYNLRNGELAEKSRIEQQFPENIDLVRWAELENEVESIEVKAFMHLSAAEFPGAKFVMLVDDDVYLKIDQLSENLRKANRPKLYFGEVWSVKFTNKQEPIRDPESPYHLPADQYPMPHLLPYASGPHYVVAMDNVRFISKNYWRLSSMNGLEDVSSGFWLRTMQVHAQHTRDFSSVRSSMAWEDNLVSFADLSPLGIRSIHANVLRNRSFFHGFHSVTWHRHLNSIPELEEMLQRPTQAAKASPSLQLETLVDASAPDRVTVIVSTPSHAGTKWQFLSSVESVETFTQKLVTQARLLFPDPTPTLTTTLLHELQRVLRLPPPFATSEAHFLG
ncbi:Beta-1,3-galactosyltransferase 4 [Phytophthora pseudosyringae]|uniref:Hexosyltransferase n=1 Tax=Phytophthora pseudosyringae TaxID=221518 RepID=A0A8T1W7A7_9STRA|nr:Beta-1,3-galactosyltransferase 4 [Phytophthora pseudosyringae]